VSAHPIGKSSAPARGPAARIMGFVVPVRPGAALIAVAARLMALAAVMG